MVKMSEVSIKNNVIFIDDIDISIKALNSLAILENRIFKESIIITGVRQVVLEPALIF